jgi:hypothetical protein
MDEGRKRVIGLMAAILSARTHLTPTGLLMEGVYALNP